MTLLRLRMFFFVPFFFVGCWKSHERDGDGAVVSDAGMDAMASFDGGTDGGAPVDAPLATSCLEAMESAVGAPCAFEGACIANDLCCGAYAICYDGRVTNRDAPAACMGALRPTGCEPSAGGIVGDTPLGAIDFASVHASFTFAFAVDVALIFTASPELVICGGDRLSIALGPTFDASGETTYVGVHDAVAQLVVGGELVRAPAAVEVTFYGGPTASEPTGRIAGTVIVSAPGWMLGGRFDAPGCEEIDRSGP